MLSQEPYEAAPNAKALWRKLIPLSLDQIWQYAKNFDP